MIKETKKPVLLCILDGWGIGDKNPEVNAIFKANTPNYDEILENYPYSRIGTSGLAVGLPEGQIGNSEVGHVTIGSGRVIYQDLPRINKAISNNELENNKHLKQLIKKCQEHDSSCHLIGLLSNGGVHSHQEHIIYLAKSVAQSGVDVKIHAFLDGRDVDQKSAITSIEQFQNEVKEFNNIEIVTIGGRYYGMDRDNKWDRIKIAYDAIVNAAGKKSDNTLDAIKTSYEEDITDEFLVPTSIGNYCGIKDNDAILVANFRADRIRQISHPILDPEFKEFSTRKLSLSSKVAMTEYSETLSNFYSILFPPIEIKNSLGEILQNNNLSQLRIAETEKYAHVTFFFSGGQEKEYKGENRILVKSPDVATYDLEPKMSAEKIGEKLVEAINSNQYDFIVVNYANPDMVGHSGVFDSAVTACEIIDDQLKKLKESILKQDGLMLITADHGNIENMITESGKPHTAHTTNPVPLILIGNNVDNIKVEDGTLADITPTILDLMNLETEKEITGRTLIKKS